MSEAKSKLPIIRKNVKSTSEWYTLIAFGDIHLGHNSCDEEAAAEMVKWIAKKSINECGVVLTGDLIENVLPSTKGSLFEMKYPSPDKQVEVVTELLKPMAKNILMVCDGNHEDRTQRTAGITISKTIAKDLGAPYVGYHGMLDLTLQHGKQKQLYSIYVEHGCGAIPRSVGGRYNRLESIQKQVEADIYIKGHIHHKCVFSKRVWKRVNGNTVKRKIMFASNGSYLQDAEYAIRSGFEPTEAGVAKILLSSKDFNTHCSI